MNLSEQKQAKRSTGIYGSRETWRERKKQIETQVKAQDERRRADKATAEKEQRKYEAVNRVNLTLTDKEFKLLNLALDSCATENEWQSALLKFGESLRARHQRVN
jgi:hypothetical protein